MKSDSRSFSDILIRQAIISPDQLSEAERLAKSKGTKVGDELVHLGYATGEEVMQAIATEHRLEYVELK